MFEHGRWTGNYPTLHPSFCRHPHAKVLKLDAGNPFHEEGVTEMNWMRKLEARVILMTPRSSTSSFNPDDAEKAGEDMQQSTLFMNKPLTVEAIEGC